MLCNIIHSNARNKSIKILMKQGMKPCFLQSTLLQKDLIDSIAVASTYQSYCILFSRQT